jgi:alkylation response protein AidB-like acyl-CoA dehydrogenase
MSVVTTTSEGSAERQEVVGLARELGRRELAPHALDLDEGRSGALDAAWGHVAEVGFDRALLAVDDGGVGLDAGSLLLCLEEIAVGDGGVALLVLLSNAALAALPPERAAGIGEAERWALVPAPSARLGTAARIAIGSDTSGRLTVDGALCPAPGALGADGIVVVAGGAEPAVLALEAGSPGLRIEVCEPLLGLKSAAAGRISLSGAEAEAASGPAEAELTANASLALLRAGTAAIARGVARRAYEMAIEYAHARVQGGVPIVQHDAVREMLISMAVRLAATPSIATDCGAALIAKIAASEDAVAIATDAVQVFGGTGYMHETGVEKLMRDAKVLQLWPEPNWIAGEELVGPIHPPSSREGHPGS